MKKASLFVALLLMVNVAFGATHQNCATIPYDVEKFYKEILGTYYDNRCHVISMILENFPNEPEVALAIAMQESSLRTYARNTKGKDNSTGIFQINIIHPPKVHGLDKMTPDDAITYLSNPRNNISVAKEMRKRYGWKRWGAYTSGKFRKYLVERRT